MVSFKHKFIFVHIPKTAGKSIMQILPDVQTNAEAFPEFSSHKLGRRYLHMSAQEMSGQMEEEDWASFFKFAIVRNPWDRVVSEYFWRKRSPHRTSFDTFESFITALEGGWEFEIDDKRHIAPQCELITNDSGEIIVDFVGRYERLEESVKEIFNILELDPPKFIPLLNNTPVRAKYRTYYSIRTRKRVEKLYPKDIDLFLYTF